MHMHKSGLHLGGVMIAIPVLVILGLWALFLTSLEWLGIKKDHRVW